MARQEHDREDILREATALTERIEILFDEQAEPIVIGFRRDGSASIFIGQDPVFQFNRAGELRRGYLNGRLIKAEHGALVALQRRRTPSQTQLIRHAFGATDEAEYLQLVRMHLDRIEAKLTEGTFKVLGQVPIDGDVIVRIRAWLPSVAGDIRIAARPNAGRSRSGPAS